MVPLFATPWAFAALAALPALAALYYLRNSYRPVVVSSLTLWRDLLESRASGLKVERMRTPLLFFLELAILGLLAFAATGPRWETRSGDRPLAVVLDDSLSMHAGGDRSARALAETTLLAEFSGALSTRFVLAGETPQALGDAVHGRVEMAEALAGWTCRSPAARVPEAIALARELAGDGARILVVSDRKPPEPPTGRIVWRSFGDARPNVALVRAGRVAKDGVDRVTFEIANFSEGPRDVRLVVSAGNHEVHMENLALARRETRRLAFRLPAGVGPIAAKLADADALPIDDVCWLVAEETPPIRVDVRLADDALRKPVEAAFRAGGRTQPAGKSVHLVVADGPDWPDVPADAWIVQILAEKEAEAFLGPFVMDKTHPLTEGLGLDGVVWGAGKSHDLPGAPVLLAGNVPLASEVEMATGQRRLRLRLRHDLSTLTQAPAWPIWWWNVAQWRASAMPGLRRGNVRLGEPAVLRTPPGVEQVTVHGPGGSSTLPARAQRAVVPAPDVGLYEIVQSDEKIPFAVNAVNAEESDLSTCESGEWGEWPDDGAAAPGMRGIAWLLMLLALAVMAWHLHLVRQGAE